MAIFDFKTAEELLDMYNKVGLGFIGFDQNRQPINSGRYLKKDDLGRLELYKFGIELGNNGLQMISFYLNESNASEQIKYLASSLEKRLNNESVRFVKVSDNSTQVQFIYRNGNLSKSRKLAQSISGNILVETKAAGELFVFDSLDMIPSTPPNEVITNNEVKFIYSVGCYFDEKLLDNPVGEEFNRYNRSSTILEDHGWTHHETSVLGAKYLYQSDFGQDECIVYPNNRAFVYSNSSLLPNFQSLTATDLTVYLDHIGDYEYFYSKHGNVSSETEYSNPKPTNFRVEKLSHMLKRTQGLPPVKELFGEFWHENELCILFGPTNTGKSTLAVQIALSLDKGKSEFEDFTVSTKSKKVLYFDLELSERQVHDRLSGLTGKDCNVIRVDWKPESEINLSSLNYLFNDIESIIQQEKAEVLILDNLSVICPNNEKASEATVLLKYLNGIKKKHKMDILVLAHTPKIIEGLIIELKHLAGSAQIGNLADSVVSIAKTREKNVKYLKQHKVRAKEFKYDTNSVLPIEMVTENDWLHFVPKETLDERTLLSIGDGKNLKDRNAQICEMKLKGATVDEIQQLFGLKKSAVYQIIKEGGDSIPMKKLD